MKRGNGEPFEEKLRLLAAQLEAQFAESARLERAIRGNLRRITASESGVSK